MAGVGETYPVTLTKVSDPTVQVELNAATKENGAPLIEVGKTAKEARDSGQRETLRIDSQHMGSGQKVARDPFKYLIANGWMTDRPGLLIPRGAKAESEVTDDADIVAGATRRGNLFAVGGEPYVSVTPKAIFEGNTPSVLKREPGTDCVFTGSKARFGNRVFFGAENALSQEGCEAQVRISAGEVLEIEKYLLESGSGTLEAGDVIMRKLTSGSGGTAPVTHQALTSLNSTQVTDSYSTPSISPTADRLVTVTVFSDRAGATPSSVPTLSGGGMTTWTQVVTQTLPGGGRLTVFRALQASPSSGALTADFAGEIQERCKISVSEWANVDGTGSNGENAIVQAVGGASSVKTASLQVSVAAPESDDNASLAIGVTLEATGTIVPNLSAGPGSAQANYQNVHSLSGTDNCLRTQWADFPTETHLRVSLPTGSAYLAGIYIEIKNGAGTTLSSFQSQSIAPTGDCLVIAVVHGYRDAGASAAPTLSGNGITWTQVNTQVFDTDHRITMYRGMVASPTAGKVTITFAAAQDSCRWSIVEFANVDTGGTHGSAAVVQSAIGTETGQTTFDAITLSAFGSADNATFGAYAINNTGGMTAGTGFTEIHDVVSGGGLMTQWRIDNDTSPTATSTDSGNWGGIAIEIKSAAPIGSYTTSLFTPTAERLILVAVHNTKATPDTPTVAGFNLTWVSAGTVTQGNERLTLFRALSLTALEEGLLTIDFGGTAQDAVRWSIVEFANVLTTGDDGEDAIVQVVTDTASGAASLAITLAALGDDNNATYGAFAVNVSSDIVPGSGYEQLHEEEEGGETLMTEWRQDGSVTVDASTVPSGSPGLLFAQGTYTGDGGTQAISGLGFTPKVVVVKANHATNGHAMMRSDTMSAAQNVTNSTEDGGIASLDADGFTVTHVASAVGRTNESGKTYYWYAVGGASVDTGTYVGNAATRDITGVGFQPVMVWIRRQAVDGTFFRTTDMSTESYNFAVSLGATNEITGFVADGFSLGASSNVNANNETFHYIAFKTETNLHTGSYAGNSSDGRALPASPMSFDPDLVVIKADAGQEAVFKVTSLAGDASLQYGTVAAVANRIQSLTPATGKFEVGTDAEVNNSAITAYYFFAMEAAGAGGAAWAGIGIEIARVASGEGDYATAGFEANYLTTVGSRMFRLRYDADPELWYMSWTDETGTDDPTWSTEYPVTGAKKATADLVTLGPNPVAGISGADMAAEFMSMDTEGNFTPLLQEGLGITDIVAAGPFVNGQVFLLSGVSKILWFRDLLDVAVLTMNPSPPDDSLNTAEVSSLGGIGPYGDMLWAVTNQQIVYALARDNWAINQFEVLGAGEIPLAIRVWPDDTEVKVDVLLSDGTAILIRTYTLYNQFSFPLPDSDEKVFTSSIHSQSWISKEVTRLRGYATVDAGGLTVEALADGVVVGTDDITASGPFAIDCEGIGRGLQYKLTCEDFMGVVELPVEIDYFFVPAKKDILRIAIVMGRDQVTQGATLDLRGRLEVEELISSLVDSPEPWTLHFDDGRDDWTVVPLDFSGAEATPESRPANDTAVYWLTVQRV